MFIPYDDFEFTALAPLHHPDDQGGGSYWSFASLGGDKNIFSRFYGRIISRPHHLRRWCTGVFDLELQRRVGLDDLRR